jgi:hypothetical protein
MRIAFLILAHKNPSQLERMLNAMDHPAFDYFIHVDRKADQSAFGFLSKRNRVYFIRHAIKVFWGRYSLVQATLNGIGEILQSGEYDYIHVMSAQDFPIKPPQEIYQYLQDKKGSEFITCIKESDNHEWWQDAALHVWRYNFHNWRIPGKYRLQFLANKLLPPRKYPIAGHLVVGHSNWFTLTGACARYMIDYLVDHPEVVRFFKYTWGADELIFSTVVYNSRFQEKIEKSLVYIDWSERVANPKLLTIKDFHAIMTSGCLFARKFDIEKDESIVRQLEAWLKGDHQLSGPTIRNPS